jgi:hypothetical protein
MAALTAAAVLSSCERQPPVDETPTVNVADKAPPVAVSEPPLDRAGLVIAAIRVASAISAGEDDRALQQKLDGRRFEVRMRFGCTAAASETRGWRFKEDDRSLRLQVTPDLSKEDPAVTGLGGDSFESVEGFWLQRPWMLSAACPRPAQSQPQPEPKGDEEPAADIEQPAPAIAAWRLGVAQFYGEADSRTSRRDQRPYQATKVLDPGQQPSPQGYDFILTGRLRALPDKRVIACLLKKSTQPPDCIVSVHVDGARMERPDTKELLAEWSGG